MVTFSTWRTLFICFTLLAAYCCRSRCGFFLFVFALVQQAAYALETDFLVTHDALGEEEHDDHDNYGENDLAETVAEEGNFDETEERAFVQEAEDPLGKGYVEEGGDAAAIKKL